AGWGAGGPARRRLAPVSRRRGGDRDAVADNDGVVADQNLLDDEAYDSLALEDVKRIGGAAQSCEERRESLGQAQEHARSLAWSAIACSSARNACSRWRSDGIRSRNCSIETSSS